MPEHLTDEEGVAPGLGGDLRRQPPDLAVDLMTGSACHQLRDLVRVQAGEGDAFDARGAVQAGEQAPQRMARVQVGVAERRDQQQWQVRGGGRDVVEQRERLLVRPLQIIEHDGDGARRAQSLEQSDDGREEHVTLGLGVGRLYGRDAGDPEIHRPDQPPDLAAVLGDVPRQDRAGRTADEMRQRGDPRPVRRSQRLRRAAPARREPGRVRFQGGCAPDGSYRHRARPR